MNAASLFVRIGCDAEDFTRGMSKAEKAAKKGLSEIGEAAAKMTEFFSIEFAGAALEFAHLAADAQDASARLTRVFGSAAGEVREQLERMTSVIPESVAQLQTLAVQSDNMLQGLGYGAEAAATMSVEMVKLAGDMAAFAHVPMGEALDALDRGLAGKTRGLIQFGIVVSQQQIHLEAMKRGLIDNHRVLTELGTAEISRDLILKASTRIQGEAARTADQASNSWKFLKASAEEMGVSIGNVVLPPVVALVHGLKGIAETIEHTSTGVKSFVLGVGGVVAVVGPAILLITRFAKEVIVLQRAMALFTAGEGIAAIIGGFAAAPVVIAIATVAALAAAVGGLYWGVKKLWDLADGTSGEEDADAAARANDAAYMAAIRKKHAKMAQHGEAVKGAMSVDARTPLDIFKEHASLVQDQFKDAIDSGAPLVRLMTQMNVLHDQALKNLAAQKGQWTEMAKEAAKVARETLTAKLRMDVASAMATGRNVQGAIGAASEHELSPTKIALNLADAAIQADGALKTRELAEAEAKLVDVFDALRVAAIDMAEAQRKAAHDMNPAMINSGLEAAKLSAELALLTREAALKLPDAFNATREAALEFGEQLRTSSHDLAMRLERLKRPINPYQALGEGVVSNEEAKAQANTALASRELAVWLRQLGGAVDYARAAAVALQESFIAASDRFHSAVAGLGAQASNLGGSLLAGLQDGAAAAASALGPMALAAQAVGAVMQGLQPLIDALFQPLVALGRIIGIELAPLLHPLFESLKLFGIATALVGEVIYSVAGGIAHAIGGLISSIGAFIKKIPFLGGIGGDIQNFGNSISTLGNSFQETAANLDTARRQLQDMKWDPYGLHGLASAANAAASAMLNVPTGYRAMLARFNATVPVAPAPWTPTTTTTTTGAGTTTPTVTGGGVSRTGAIDDQTPLIINLDGRAIARTTLAVLKAAAQRASGETKDWAQVQAI